MQRAVGWEAINVSGTQRHSRRRPSALKNKASVNAFMSLAADQSDQEAQENCCRLSAQFANSQICAIRLSSRQRSFW
jgi:hypothetical protein